MSDTARILHACGDQMVIERTAEDGSTSVQSGKLLRDGQTLNETEEVLTLARRKSDPNTFDVTVLHKGPARAASPRYRTNHEAIFGKSKAEKQLLN